MSKRVETTREDSSIPVSIREDLSLPTSALNIPMPNTKPPKSDSDKETGQSQSDDS